MTHPRSMKSLSPVQLRLIAVTLVLPWAAACAVTPPESAALEAAVRSLVGTAACSSDEQCRTLPFGAKACGGPQSYLAWSILNTDQAALKAAAEKYAAQRREEIRASGLMSDCALVADPGAYCAASAPAGSSAGQRTCRLRGPEQGRGRAAI